MVNAVSAFEPDKIAKAVAIIAPSVMSAGTAAPTCTTPKEINSIDAPTIKPFSKSPKTTPTRVPAIRGRSKFKRPNKRESNIQNTPINPSNIDCTNM